MGAGVVGSAVEANILKDDQFRQSRQSTVMRMLCGALT